MTGASAVIVGGGVMGASVAYHLARRGWRDLLVLEQAERPGEGSTGRATGGFRAQYATAINVRLSLLAREQLLGFQQETGVDPGYAPHGYLWLASGAAEVAALQDGQRIQHAAGLHEAAMLGPDEVARLNPAIELAGIDGAAWCPTDGFIHPLQILGGYLAAARRLGVRVECGTAVTGVRRHLGGRLQAVETSRGVVTADLVVNAAGAWAALLGALAGVDVQVHPLRRQVAVTMPCTLLPADMPMTIFAGDGFHLRVRDGRVLLLRPTAAPAAADTAAVLEPVRGVDPAWLAEVVATAARRVPVLAGVPIDTPACWSGWYEMSPDKHAILGAAPGCDNFFLINGSSGHGVMHSPALGLLLAEIISDGRASTLDTAALRPSRFAEGEPNPVSELL